MPRAVLFLLSLLVACGDSGTGPGSWRADRRIRWMYGVGTEIYYGSPALSPDEATVYVGTSASAGGQESPDNALIALDVATGAPRWRFALGSAEVRSSPAVAADGSVTVLVERRNSSPALPQFELVRLSATGVQSWRRPLGAPGARVDVGFSAPTIAVDGSVYVATDSLYKVTSAGEIAWSALSTGEDLRASAALGANGTVYFASHNVPLTALHPDSGRVLWSLPLGINDHVLATPAIGGDGAIYIATNACVLHAVEPTGTLRWRFDATAFGANCNMRSSPAIGSDGTIYLGTKDGEPAAVMLAVRPNGTLRWAFLPPGLPSDVPFSHFDIYSSPAIGEDGTLYFGQEFGRIYAIDAETGAEEWMVEARTGITWSSPVLTAQGVLIISDLDGTVYALTTASQGLDATAPWPRYRGGNASTGRR